MTEEELREIERRVESDPDLEDVDENWLGKNDVRRLIAEVRRLRIGDAHMESRGLTHVVCMCDKCVILPTP